MNNASLRIEMVLPRLIAAGQEVMVAELALGLARRGHSVGVTCIEAEGEFAPWLQQQGIRVCAVPTPGVMRNFFPRELANWFRDVAPDVVHVHSGCWLKAAAAARRAGVQRVVNTVHGLPEPEHWYDRPLMRRASRRTDVTVPVSDALRGYLINDVGLSGSNVVTVVNGIDVDSYAPGETASSLRADIGVPADAPLVGCVARLAEVKNHACLLRAFAEIHRVRPDVHLALIGDGPLRDTILQQRQDLGLAEVVHLTGVRDDTPDVYRTIDLLVLASRSEGTSLSILEGMASELPVVATAVGGTPVLLADGACGTLVPSDEPQALAAGIMAMLADPAGSRGVAAAARACVIETYSHSAMLDRYEALYRSGSLPEVAH